MKIREKTILAYIEESAKAIDLDNHRITFVVSVDKVDRDDEIIEAQAVAAAVRSPDFVANPVCLAYHKHKLDTGMPPVVGSWDPATYKLVDGRSLLTLQFAVDTKLGSEYWKLYSKRHMRAVSMGFQILDGHGGNIDGLPAFVITKIELIEISCVAVGANAEALAQMKRWTHADTLDVKSISDQIAKIVTEKFAQQITIWLQEDQTIIQINENLEEIKALIVPDSDEFAEELLGKASESNPSAGTKITAEQILNAFTKAIEGLNKKENNDG